MLLHRSAAVHLESPGKLKHSELELLVGDVFASVAASRAYGLRLSIGTCRRTKVFDR
jgi:hypothetical protein